MFEIGAFFEFWLVFNILLNKWRGRPIDYLGRKSWLDKIERKSPSFIFNLFAKVVITAGMIYGYYHPYLLDNNYWK